MPCRVRSQTTGPRHQDAGANRRTPADQDGRANCQNLLRCVLVSFFRCSLFPTTWPGSLSGSFFPQVCVFNNFSASFSGSVRFAFEARPFVFNNFSGSFLKKGILFCFFIFVFSSENPLRKLSCERSHRLLTPGFCCSRTRGHEVANSILFRIGTAGRKGLATSRRPPLAHTGKTTMLADKSQAKSPGGCLRRSADLQVGRCSETERCRAEARGCRRPCYSANHRKIHSVLDGVHAVQAHANSVAQPVSFVAVAAYGGAQALAIDVAIVFQAF